MPTIAEIRSKYPGAYDDMSDADLAGAMHTKFYSDMPRAEFDQKIGFGAPAPPVDDSPRGRGRATAMEKGGPFEAAISGLAEGGVGNLPNYPVALAAGVRGALSGQGFSKPYNDQLEELAGQSEGLREKYPGTTLGGILTGAVATAVGPSKFITAPKLLGRMGQSAATGAALGAFQGGASGEGAEGRLVGAGQGAALGGVLGGAGEAVISGAGKVVNRALGGARSPAPGVVPAERIAAGDEFGVSLSRGQATGDVTQQAYEEAARNAAKGAAAQRIVGGFDRQQAAELAAAREGVMPGAVPAEAGAAVADALKGRAQQLRSGAEDAYGAAAQKDASIASDEVAKLGQRVATRLEEEGIKLDTYGNYPGAQSAMNLLRRVSGFEGAPEGQVVAQSLQGLEQARKGLLKVKGANQEDYRALGAIKRSFDDWITDAVDQKLFAGDATALDDLKQARSLWSQYKGLTKGGKDDATPIIAKIVNEERTGDEVANWLLASSNVGQVGKSARIASEVKSALGASSPEWEALRQAAWTKITTPAKGDGPQAVSTAIMSFVDGSGKPLAQQLFTADELGKMYRLAKLMKYTVPEKAATNPSKSGYEVARAISGLVGLPAAGAAGTYFSGDPKYLALAALPLIKSGARASKALSAVRAQPGRALVAPVARGGLLTGTSAEASQ